MKALQPLVATNARRKVANGMTFGAATKGGKLLFSPFSSFVSQNREYAHISQ